MPFQQLNVGPRNPLCKQPRLGLAPIAPLGEPPDQKSVRSIIDEDLGCGRLVGGPQCRMIAVLAMPPREGASKLTTQP